MVVVCNAPDAVDELLGGLEYSMPAVSLVRLARMHGRQHAENMVKLREDARYSRALHAIAGIGARDGELPLNLGNSGPESRIS
jgi:beta-N-acetylhexosaminidase